MDLSTSQGGGRQLQLPIRGGRWVGVHRSLLRPLAVVAILGTGCSSIGSPSIGSPSIGSPSIGSPPGVASVSAPRPPASPVPLPSLLPAPTVASTAPPAPTAPPGSSADGSLARRPFAPTDVALFLPEIFPDAPPVVPLEGAVPDEAAARTMLQEYAEEARPDGSLAAPMTDVYDDPAIGQRVPDPSLRAALAGLVETYGEPAIDFVRSSPLLESIRFAPPDAFAGLNPRGIAFVLPGTASGTLRIIFRDVHAAEIPSSSVG